MTIKFGIVTPGRGPVTIDQIEKVWVEAEQYGLDSIHTYDHVTSDVPTNRKGAIIEAYTSLAYLAGKTSKITFGPLISPARRMHPALRAKMTAMLDNLSGGRFMLAMGLSGPATWRYVPEVMDYIRERSERIAKVVEEAAGEWTEWGYPLMSPGKIIPILKEELDVIKALWTEEDVTYEGEHYQLLNANIAPKPIQNPRPKIILGLAFGTKKMPKLAAESADGFCVHNDRDETCVEQLRVLRENCERLGKNWDDVIRMRSAQVTISETRWSEDEYHEYNAKAVGKNVDEYLIFRDLSGPRYGTVDEIIELFRGWVDLGFNYITPMLNGVATHGAPDHKPLQLFAEKVIPAVRDYKPRR